MGRDSKGRTLAKTMVYRLVAIALLAAITYYLTGDAGEATTITILFNVGGTGAYYALERLWESVEWGRSPTMRTSLRIAGPGHSIHSSDPAIGASSAAESSLLDDVEAK